ncbi:MAG: hypothetical protein GC137_02005 [Alphaproteobacteria bacterium]|nr:hypothetical protein [Alphaproteobacteria bacterium]
MKLYVPVYAITLLLSAALLFTVQPMFSKMILPLLGGTPRVWTTAMLFFQISLLAGYAYAHGTSKFLSIRTQAILHIIILIAFFAFLPFGIPESWPPPTDSDPTLWQLGVMSLTIGPPFFIISGSAPMFQRWFAATKHKDADNPYFLYGASNLGSMSGLLLYPVLIEPMMTLNQQATSWMYGYIILIVFAFACFALAWNSNERKAEDSAGLSEKITWENRIKWLLVSCIPSSLMLGVTTFLTTDIASVPLLWVLPLSLYIGTFILVFARKPMFSENVLLRVSQIAAIALIIQMIALKDMFNSPLMLIAFHLFVFFVCTLSCHMSLANAKPSAKNLTEFYFFMSLGGAIGGIFNGLIAPVIFVIPVEYAIALSLSVLIPIFYATKEKDGSFFKFNNFFGNEVFLIPATLVFCLIGFIIQDQDVLEYGLGVFVILLFVMLFEYKRHLAIALTLIFLVSPISLTMQIILGDSIVLQDRNFFGVIRIFESDKERNLLHGTTNHGTQALDESYKFEKLSYYSDNSPLSDAISILDARDGPQKIGVIGLGVGVTACFTKEERFYDFYEIDKDIADIAQNPEYFTYLSGCGSDYRILLGDGRLKILEVEDERYDLILVDAFSSDNIPVHLITREAIEIYFKKLLPDGMLIFNISNNYIDLEPVLKETAVDLGLNARAKLSDAREIDDTGIKTYIAHFFAMSKNPAVIGALDALDGWSEPHGRAGVRVWTDQYSNIISVLGNNSGFDRIRAIRQESPEDIEENEEQLKEINKE